MADLNILQENWEINAEPEVLQIVQEEVKRAIQSLKGGKSPGVDSVPAELIKVGGEDMVKVFIIHHWKIWATKQWP